MRRKKYNPKNCQQKVVAQFTDTYGNTIGLLSHHAFKWCILKDIDGRIIITQMSRKEAKREYERLKLVRLPKK